MQSIQSLLTSTVIQRTNRKAERKKTEKDQSRWSIPHLDGAVRVVVLERRLERLVLVVEAGRVAGRAVLGLAAVVDLSVDDRLDRRRRRRRWRGRRRRHRRRPRRHRRRGLARQRQFGVHHIVLNNNNKKRKTLHDHRQLSLVENDVMLQSFTKEKSHTIIRSSHW